MNQECLNFATCYVQHCMKDGRRMCELKVTSHMVSKHVLDSQKTALKAQTNAHTW